MMGRNNQELIIHKAIVQHFRIRLPDDCLWLHIPNGEKRSPRTGARLKAMGVRPGAADLIIIWRGQIICMEIKAPKGRQEPAQRDFAELAMKAGARYIIATSSAEALAKLVLCGIPLKPVFDTMSAADYRGAA